MVRRLSFFSALALAVALIALVISSSGSSVTASAPSNESGDVIPGRYIVVLRDGVDAPGFAARHGIRPDVTYTAALSGFAGPLSRAAVARLESDPNVVSVEPDRIVTTDLHANLFETLPAGVDRIDAETPGNTTGNTTTGPESDIDIAVIDTGIQPDHPDLNVAGGVRFIGVTCSGGSSADDNGHGTHVAGTAAARDNAIGVVGVAPGARLWAVKVLDQNGSGSLSCVTKGIDWVTANAADIEVANMSLGCNCSTSAGDTALANSAAAGVVYAVAAGNSAADAKDFWPAKHPDVLSTSAIADFNGASGGGAAATCRPDVDDTFADFSNFGQVVDIAAPGVCIVSTYTGGMYATLSGTSMASPHVAGAAARYMLVHGKPTNAAGVADVRNGLIAAGAAQTSPCGFSGDPDSPSGTGPAAEPLVWLGSPCLAPPAVNVALSADKTAYISGTDTAAVMTAVVKDETGAAISGLVSSAFVTTVDGVSASATFSETATAGTYTGDLDISGLADGAHTVEVTVTDSRPVSGSGSASFTTGPAPTSATEVIVNAITYSTDGGNNGTKHLNITVSLLDDLGNVVAGASVSIDLYRAGSKVASGAGTTGIGGTVTFSLKNAPSGIYSTTVTAVTANGLTWDGVTPSNSFTK